MSKTDRAQGVKASGAASAANRFSSNLNASDAVLWNIERDPCLRTTIVAIFLLDRVPDWERLRERIVEASTQVPRLRQRVVTSSLHVGPPRWQYDEAFDLDYHLRRVVCPAPGELRTVLDLAAPIAMAAFDKDRPLWEFTLVEGLSGGRAALIQKVHHSFTDGIGGMKLAGLILDTTRARPRHAAPIERTHPKQVSTVEAALGSIADDVRAVTDASVRGSRLLPGLAAAAVLQPARLVKSGVRGVRSVVKLMAPARSPLSPVMDQRGMSRWLATFDVPLEEMLAAAHAADSTLNDAFLASLTDGLRRYHERHGAPVSELRVTMPINLRRPDDPLGSNRFVPARLAIPIDAVDAAERMRRLGELARGWRREPSLPFSDTIAGALNRLPVAISTSVLGGMLKAIDFVATNVPGFSHRMYLAGAEVVREYAFAPPSGAAFSVALLSHGDQCCIGINVDTTAVPDAANLVACLQEGFDDVLSIGPHPKSSR